jgi:hypothetical protein
MVLKQIVMAYWQLSIQRNHHHKPLVGLLLTPTSAFHRAACCCTSRGLRLT